MHVHVPDGGVSQDAKEAANYFAPHPEFLRTAMVAHLCGISDVKFVKLVAQNDDREDEARMKSEQRWNSYIFTDKESRSRAASATGGAVVVPSSDAFRTVVSDAIKDVALDRNGPSASAPHRYSDLFAPASASNDGNPVRKKLWGLSRVGVRHFSFAKLVPPHQYYFPKFANETAS